MGCWRDAAGAHGGSTDESALYISGGLQLALGLDDEANDAFGIGEHDLIDEDYSGADVSATI